jgi:hypothetical protein
VARRDDLLELLRPPAHRGPLIAAGAVVFTVGLALAEVRLDDSLPRVVHVFVLALAAALIYGLGVRAEPEDGRPPAYQSMLLVCGLLLIEGGLVQLARLLGAGFDAFPAGTFVWTSLLLCAAALYPAVVRNSAISGMVAAVAIGAAVLSAANWAFGVDSQAVFRWLLLGLAAAFALGSLALRGERPRHAELLVVSAGLATLTIALAAAVTTVLGELAPFAPLSSGGGFLPGFWEFVVLAAGCGLIAYGAVDHVPGAASLGFANLVAFVAAATAGADATLAWWPFSLLAIGGGAMVAGLRPRRPLPPEPAGYSVRRPLASVTDDDLVIRVRNDERPSR